VSKDTLNKLKAFREAAFADLIEIPVPEIEETWYASTTMSLRDYRRINAIPAGIDWSLETVLVLAKTADGKRLFTDANKADLEAIPPGLITRVAREIWEHLKTPNAEESEKKS